MRYHLLGKSGLRVSELSLGTMTLGASTGWQFGTEDDDECRRMFDLYVDAGGNFVDTALMYANGESEQAVGRLIASDRDRFVVSTKYSSNTDAQGDVNASGNHRKNLVRSLESSLRRLGTDHVDLYWVHAPDFMTPLDELIRALDDQVRLGKVLYVGVSNFPAWQVARANTLAELHGWSPFVAMTIEYSLLERTPERELFPMARALDVGITAWSPLGHGILSGKYNSNGDGAARRLDTAPLKQLTERNLEIARVVGEVATETGATASQVALAWVVAQGVIPVVGARTAGQMAENLGALAVELTSEHLARLDAVSAVDLGFPREFLLASRRATYGGTLAEIHHHRADVDLPPELAAAARLDAGAASARGEG